MSHSSAVEAESGTIDGLGRDHSSNGTANVSHSRKRKAAEAVLDEWEAAVEADGELHSLSAIERRALLRPSPRPDYVSQPPDFAALARLYPFFAPFVQVRGSARRASVDFGDARAISALTRVLLLHDFQLHFELPAHNLCPPVPQRLAVLSWVDGLLREQQQCLSSAAPPRRGVDVGCGASCIFPLLGRRSFGWQFVATEADQAAIVAARHNVQLNDMQSGVEVREVLDRRQLLVGVLAAADGHFDFLVCNPPFFHSPAQAQLNPHRASAATQSELCCEGGELAFVRRLYADSVQLRRQLGWVAVMLGKKDTLRVLRAELVAAQQRAVGAARGSGPCQIRTTTFEQGKQTRWGLAWTFNALLPAPTSSNA